MLNPAEFLNCENLPPGSLIDVETKSRHYHIECLGGTSIRISGHPEYCPEPVAAHLEGSFDRENGLEWGLIGRGKRMVFLLDEREHHPVTTSKVLSIQVNQPSAIQPESSQSIH